MKRTQVVVECIFAGKIKDGMDVSVFIAGIRDSLHLFSTFPRRRQKEKIPVLLNRTAAVDV